MRLAIRHLTFSVLVCTAALFTLQAHADTPVQVDPPAANLKAANLQAYLEAIRQLESGEGAYAPALQEQLLSLGLGMQQSGLHQQAIDVFKRGTHLARINNGLYSAEQIPLLQGEITSHIALGQYSAADERQHYLLRVQLRSPEGDESRASAFLAQADWQFRAYQLGVASFDFERIMRMWELYRMALNEIIKQDGQTSAKLLYPLRGMLRTQYLISAFQPGPDPSRDSFGIHQQQNRFHAYRAQSYKKGQAIALALYDVEKAVHGTESTGTTQALTMLGDWSLWNGKYDTAVNAYQRAIAELVARAGAETELESLFGEPRAIPDIDGIRRLPDIASEGDGKLQLNFAVSVRGRVSELNRIDANEIDKTQANRLMRTLRKTTFRPRFELGEPVNTDNIVWTYDLQ